MVIPLLDVSEFIFPDAIFREHVSQPYFTEPKSAEYAPRNTRASLFGSTEVLETFPVVPPRLDRPHLLLCFVKDVGYPLQMAWME
jgi:hypothetical protein